MELAIVRRNCLVRTLKQLEESRLLKSFAAELGAPQHRRESLRVGRTGSSTLVIEL
jgi:hypothetical protein